LLQEGPKVSEEKKRLAVCLNDKEQIVSGAAG
jgi:hypothetical protein